MIKESNFYHRIAPNLIKILIVNRHTKNFFHSLGTSNEAVIKRTEDQRIRFTKKIVVTLFYFYNKEFKQKLQTFQAIGKYKK